MIKNITSPSIALLTADIGGSHITSAVYDHLKGQLDLASKRRLPVDCNAPADVILGQWITALQQSAQGYPVVNGLAMAMPGPFDYTNGISYIKGFSKYESLYGLNIRDYLARALQIQPQAVRFRNDAESAIAGEAFAGAGNGRDRVVGLTLGTGFGSAVCVSGITKDLNWGAHRYQESIADDYFSTRWFCVRYCEVTGLSASGVKPIADAADTDSRVAEIFNVFAENLAEFLLTRLSAHQPEVLMVSGNISRAYRHFLEPLSRLLAPTVIRLSVLGETAALAGAAALFIAPDQTNRSPINYQ